MSPMVAVDANTPLRAVGCDNPLKEPRARMLRMAAKEPTTVRCRLG